jgi:hypothetical protein
MLVPNLTKILLLLQSKIVIASGDALSSMCCLISDFCTAACSCSFCVRLLVLSASTSTATAAPFLVFCLPPGDLNFLRFHFSLPVKMDMTSRAAYRREIRRVSGVK